LLVEFKIGQSKFPTVTAPAPAKYSPLIVRTVVIAEEIFSGETLNTTGVKSLEY